MNTLLESPLSEVDRLFEQCERDPERTKDAVLRHFQDKIDISTLTLLKVPSLNEAKAENLPAGSLVRFRCMIQDTYDPEYFVPCFQKGEKVITTLFRDVMEDEIPGFNPIDDKPMERSNWHCIAIPAENEWVQKEYAELTTMNVCPSKKRRSEEGAQSDDSARTRNRPWCHPIDNNQQSCIVKIYTDDAETCLNELVEVVGILSHLPGRAESPEAGTSNEEFNFKNPPTSIVPRVHAVFCKKISHHNPLLRYDLEENVIFRRQALEQAQNSRGELLGLLTKILLGDDHCAEYVLMYMISRVYIRRDLLPLGKFSLNLRNVNERQARLLHNLLSRLTTKTHFIEMSRKTLNESKFVPNKDYDLNRLQSGILQLSEGTLLICDENQLDAGQLGPTGVANVKALGNMIQNQSIQYNFGFHEMEFPTDIPVLYISQGKGLIKCDFHHKVIPMQPYNKLDNLEDIIDETLTEGVLIRLRRYITLIRLANHELNETLQQQVQNDFVCMRRDNPELKADDLHALLVVTRYASLSRGELELSLDSWEQAKALEDERRRRIL